METVPKASIVFQRKIYFRILQTTLLMELLPENCLAILTIDDDVTKQETELLNPSIVTFQPKEKKIPDESKPHGGSVLGPFPIFYFG